MVPRSYTNMVVRREILEAEKAQQPLRYTWDEYADQCRVEAEAVDVFQVPKLQMVQVEANRKLLIASQRRRIEMARSLRRTYAATLGRDATIIVGGDDDL